MGYAARCDALLIEDLGEQRLAARTALAVIERAGYRGRLVHFGSGSSSRDLAALALRCEPRLVVLFVYFDHLLAESLALARSIRAAGSRAHLTITGPLPAMMADELLRACPALDSVLGAEAGACVGELLRSLEEGTSGKATLGLVRRDQYGTIVSAPPPQALNLDDLPPPVRHTTPRIPGTEWGFATLEASRGCYHACAFCLPCAFYRALYPSVPYRTRAIHLILDEMARLSERGIRLFMFDDEQFLAPRPARHRQVAEYAEGIARRGLRVAFTIKCRPDDVEEYVLGSLQQAGLVRIFLGLESGHDPTLALFGKGFGPAENRRALATLSSLGTPADFRVLAFHPWATEQSFAAELAFLEQVVHDLLTPISFREVVCYPGTPLGERLRGQSARQTEHNAHAEHSAGSFADYTIADHRVEMLRRLNRLVFAPRERNGGLDERISVAWYRVLVRERLEPPCRAGREREALKAIILRLNSETLGLWHAMLNWALSASEILSSEVNQRAALWSERARQSEIAALDALEQASLA